MKKPMIISIVLILTGATTYGLYRTLVDLNKNLNPPTGEVRIF